MNIEIREYSREDWEQIKAMILKAENFGPDFLKHEKLKVTIYSEFPDFGRVLVAETVPNRDIVGFMAIQFDWRALVISSIVTHHDYLRKGIGKQLVERTKEIGKAHSEMDVIRVDTGDFMEYAQQFYQSCGFQISAHVPHYLSWYNDQVILVFQLKAEKD